MTDRRTIEDERTQRILGASLGGESDATFRELLEARPELAAHLEDLAEATASLDEAARLAREVIAEVDRETARASGGAKDDPHHEAVARILRERAAAVRRSSAGDPRRTASRWRWILLAASVAALAWLGVELLDPSNRTDREARRDVDSATRIGADSPHDDGSHDGPHAGPHAGPHDGPHDGPILLGGDPRLVLDAPRGDVDAIREFRWTSSLSLPLGGYFEVRVYEGAQPRDDRRLATSRALGGTSWALDEKETAGWRGTLCWEVVAFVPAATDPEARSAPVVVELQPNEQ